MRRSNSFQPAHVRLRVVGATFAVAAMICAGMQTTAHATVFVTSFDPRQPCKAGTSALGARFQVASVRRDEADASVNDIDHGTPWSSRRSSSQKHEAAWLRSPQE